ncbi:MAG: amidohydrolase family protein, partial [Gemmatimonadota bacterium]
MTPSKPLLPLLLLALALGAGRVVAQDADLIVVADRVWTGDDGNPWAEAVAIRGERILAVGTAADVLAHRAPSTRVIEAPDGFVTPGFIDSHTHLNNAAALLFGLNLLDVADPETFRERVREARDRLPPGARILGGDWGAYEAWARGSTGREGAGPTAAFAPDRSVIDPVTPTTPALLWR